MVKVESLTKTFKGFPENLTALSGVSLDVAEGSICALLGGNGAGKSTLLKVMATLSRPTAGRVLIDDKDTVEAPRAVRRLIGYVSQKHAVDEQASGRGNLRFQAQCFGRKFDQLGERAEDLVDLLDLGAALDKPVREYSGGMQRRLEVAMAMVHEPRVLLLDEPTTGIDVGATDKTWQYLRSLVDQLGVTVLFSSHSMQEAEKFSEHVAVLEKGSILLQGAPADLIGGLEGHTVTLGFADEQPDRESIDACLGDISGLVRWLHDGSATHVICKEPESLLPALLKKLSEAGIDVMTCKLSRPSLADVYLTVTGSEFEEDPPAVQEPTWSWR